MNKKADDKQDSTKAEQQQANDLIRAIFEDGTAEINGRSYEFLKTNHAKRLRVFGYLMKVQERIQKKDFSFMGEKDWLEIEQIINGVVSLDGTILAKDPQHWEDYAEDYLFFMPTALAVISYPFLKGKGSN